MPDQQPAASHEEPLEAHDDWLQEPEELPAARAGDCSAWARIRSRSR